MSCCERLGDMGWNVTSASVSVRACLCVLPLCIAYFHDLCPPFQAVLSSLRITLELDEHWHKLSQWWRNTKNVVNLWLLKTYVWVCLNVILTLSITLNVLVDTKVVSCVVTTMRSTLKHVSMFVTWTWVLCFEFEQDLYECILKGVLKHTELGRGQYHVHYLLFIRSDI